MYIIQQIYIQEISNILINSELCDKTLIQSFHEQKLTSLTYHIWMNWK